MTNTLEQALARTWAAKDKFYEDNKGLSCYEILEKVEGRRFSETPINKQVSSEIVNTRRASVRG